MIKVILCCLTALLIASVWYYEKEKELQVQVFEFIWTSKHTGKQWVQEYK